MTLGIRGTTCDICGLPILNNERLFSFQVTKIERELHFDENCKEVFEEFMTKRNWKVLPKGPLRKLFQEEQWHIN